MWARYVLTIRYMKPIQIWYRIFYFTRQRWIQLSGTKRLSPMMAQGRLLHLASCALPWQSYYPEDNEFRFLNRSKSFKDRIDWQFSEYGKLWNFHLNYFDFLNQPGLMREQGLDLIRDYMGNLRNDSEGMAAFPTSLRTTNWIKFLCAHNIVNRDIDASLCAQFHTLANNLEYHILGNHLLENGFSLLFGAYYFNNDDFYRLAKKILSTELDTQILADGAHFELSPMYHQIMLGRVLECIDLIQNNPWKTDGLIDLLVNKAAVMLGWIKQITFADGTIPLLNDSANGTAPSTHQLCDYAAHLSVKSVQKTLSQCGYRKIVDGSAELVVDVGPVGPDYIPAHAHADTLNFELALFGQHLIVDSGVSTYENDDIRQFQRSTAAHNCVTIDGQDSSEVWGGFRVARRARPFDYQLKNSDGSTRIDCAHNGYRRLPGKPTHRRSWSLSDKRLRIKDQVDGKFGEAIARLYLHPEVVIVSKAPFNQGQMQLEGHSVTWHVFKGQARMVRSFYYPQFGVRIPNRCIEIVLENGTCDVEITWQ